jgi:hypothetical protein
MTDVMSFKHHFYKLFHIKDIYIYQADGINSFSLISKSNSNFHKNDSGFHNIISSNKTNEIIKIKIKKESYSI